MKVGTTLVEADDGQLDHLLAAMFRHDARGRLVGDAPQVHVLRTAGRVLCRCHAAIPDATAAQIQALALAPRSRPSAWAEDYARYVSLVESAAAVTAIRAGPLFGFPDALPDSPGCVAIDAGNLDLLRGTLDEWIEDAEQGVPMVAALADGRAVSVCATVRTFEAVECAGVETAPAHRGRGLAARAVAAWAKRVRTSGSQPFYATTFDNLSSQKVAGRLGLKLIGSEFSVYGSPANAGVQIIGR